MWSLVLCLACLSRSLLELNGEEPSVLKEKYPDNVEPDDSVKRPLKVDYSFKQQIHPNPSRFTRIRKTDPIPYPIKLLKAETDRNKHIVHTNVNRGTVDLLVIVESRPLAGAWRQTIRNTWASKNLVPSSAAVTFVVPIGEHKYPELLDEVALHQDVILFKLISPSTMDSVRLMHFLYWCSTLYSYKYLLRTNDRYLIRVGKIVDSLAPCSPSDLLYMGYFIGNKAVGKDDIMWFVCPTLVPHADEGAYLLSKSLVDKFVKQFYYLSYFHSEGGSVGLWTSPFKGCRLVHSVDFDSSVSRGCANTLHTLSVGSAEEMGEKGGRLVGGGRLCTEEFVVVKSYVYNWSNLPSQCCRN